MQTFLFKDFICPQCHAATMAEDPQGNLHVAFFAGTKEKHPDTAIYVCSSSNGGKTWTQPVVEAKVNTKPHWKPGLFKDQSGIVHLFFKTGDNTMTWRTWHKVLFSNAPTQLLVDEAKNPHISKTELYSRGPVRSRPVVLPDGTWLAPSSWEQLMSKGGLILPAWWRPFFDRSKDQGKTWQRTICVDSLDFYQQNSLEAPTWSNGKGAIQPCLWLDGSTIRALLRSTQGFLYETFSEDNGVTWSQLAKTDVPNNNSGVDVAQIGQRLVLAYNPVGGNWGARTPLSLSVSLDGLRGATWGPPSDLVGGNGSFSYPTIIPYRNGFAGVYTWNRVGIVFFRGNVGKKAFKVGRLDVPAKMETRLAKRVSWRYV